MNNQNNEVSIFISGRVEDVEAVINLLLNSYEITSRSIHPSQMTPGMTRGHLSVVAKTQG